MESIENGIDDEVGDGPASCQTNTVSENGEVINSALVPKRHVSMDNGFLESDTEATTDSVDSEITDRNGTMGGADKIGIFNAVNDTDHVQKPPQPGVSDVDDCDTGVLMLNDTDSALLPDKNGMVSIPHHACASNGLSQDLTQDQTQNQANQIKNQTNLTLDQADLTQNQVNLTPDPNLTLNQTQNQSLTLDQADLTQNQLDITQDQADQDQVDLIQDQANQNQENQVAIAQDQTDLSQDQGDQVQDQVDLTKNQADLAQNQTDLTQAAVTEDQAQDQPDVVRVDVTAQDQVNVTEDRVRDQADVTENQAQDHANVTENPQDQAAVTKDQAQGQADVDTENQADLTARDQADVTEDQTQDQADVTENQAQDHTNVTENPQDQATVTKDQAQSQADVVTKNQADQADVTAQDQVDVTEDQAQDVTENQAQVQADVNEDQAQDQADIKENQAQDQVDITNNLIQDQPDVTKNQAQDQANVSENPQDQAAVTEVQAQDQADVTENQAQVEDQDQTDATQAQDQVDVTEDQIQDKPDIAENQDQANVTEDQAAITENQAQDQADVTENQADVTAQDVNQLQDQADITENRVQDQADLTQDQASLTQNQIDLINPIILSTSNELMINPSSTSSVDHSTATVEASENGKVSQSFDKEPTAGEASEDCTVEDSNATTIEAIRVCEESEDPIKDTDPVCSTGIDTESPQSIDNASESEKSEVATGSQSLEDSEKDTTSPGTINTVPHSLSSDNLVTDRSDLEHEDRRRRKTDGYKKSRSVFYTRERSSLSPPSTESQSPTSELHSPRSKKGKSLIKRVKRAMSTRETPTAEPTVSLIEKLRATDWDPTCLLEELYHDCRPVGSQSSSGELCRHSGYLDKLPVNQRKATIGKGWKHRFIRLTRGSLFYYDDEQSTKAKSFIRLADAKIVVDSKSLQIEVIEKGSNNVIVLRAKTIDDLTTWHRAMHLESVHPTMTIRSPVGLTQGTPTIIIDIGSCSIRAGLAGEDAYPQIFFPSVCVMSPDNKILAYGCNALLPYERGQGKLVYPGRHRNRMDIAVATRHFYQHVLEMVCKSLHVEPQNCNALISLSPVVTDVEKQAIVELSLEEMNLHGILLLDQSTLALYSYNSTSGIVVSIGDTISVVPIIDGLKVESGTSFIPMGGSTVTENLSKLATAKDIRYFSETEMYIVRHVKETICFSSQDYGQDLYRCEETPTSYIRAVDVDRFNLPDHRKVIHLDEALFKAPEGLFNPGIWGRDVQGVHELVSNAIEHCPIDTRRHMARHIYLAGGTTLLTGFPERLQIELEHLNPRLEIQIHAGEDRYHAAFLGAAVLASLNTFQQSLVDIDDWLANGMDAFTGDKPDT